MNTWGGVQLCRVMWDSYVRIPIFVTREISNNRFIILEPILLIASKRWVTHYPRVTKKEKKKKRPMAITINQTNKGAFTSLKGYINLSRALASNFSGWLVPLSNTCLLHFCLYLFWWGSCLGVTLVFISISTSSIVPACSIPSGYVHKSVWCVSMFNSF